MLFLQNGCDIRSAFPLRICEQRAGLSAARRRGAAGELRHGPEPETAAGAAGGRARGDPAAGPAVQVRWWSVLVLLTINRRSCTITHGEGPY